MLAACRRRKRCQLDRLGRGPRLVGKQDAPDRARRHTRAEIQQLAGDPWVAPAWVLAGEAQHELTDPIIESRTAGASTRLRPPATDEFPMPAQKRLWRHDQAASAWLRQDSRQRREEGRIGGAKRSAPLLPSENDELMSQHEQPDVFGEFAASAADEQPQQGREGEIGERKDHEPILPSPATGHSESERRSCAFS
jgi:hypothetical protein